MTNVDSVALKDAPIVFVGYGVKAPERNWDDFKGLDVKGKVLVVLINDPDFETGPDTKNGGDFGGKAMTYYGRWTYKFEEAARQGAAEVLIVHETAPASYGWATVKNSNTSTMFDIVRQEPAKAHPQLESWIQRDVAVDLFKAAGLDFDTLKRQAQSRDFKPVELKGATFSASYAVDHSVIVSKNIAGRIKGTRAPDETVIYSGHWDHLGVGQPDAKGDKHAITAPSTTPTASPPSSSWPAPSRASRPRSARSCSWPSPPRSAACWARNTTRPIRCTRSPRPSPT